MLSVMPASSAHQRVRTTPITSGWVQTGERWALRWNGRDVASVAPDGRPGVRLWMQGQKLWQTKIVRAASIAQGKRFAERWCAARLYPDVPLREAVARLVKAAPLPPMERQQVRRLAEAGDRDIARIKQALDARRPPPSH